MGVAVLAPQDCLTRHHHRHLISPAQKPRRNPNPNPNATPNPNPNSPSPNRSSRRRRNSPPPQSQPRAKSPPAMTGQIRILKRGEDLIPAPPPTKAREPQVAPRPKAGPVHPVGFYAGSAFVTSPAPSELPLPAFFFTKRNCGLSSEADHNREIASELRRVLKLS